MVRNRKRLADEYDEARVWGDEDSDPDSEEGDSLDAEGEGESADPEYEDDLEDLPALVDGKASLAILEVELPETDEWRPNHAEAALWQYAMMLDLAESTESLAAKAGPLSDQLERLNDILFHRDEIEDAFQYWGSELFDDRTADCPSLEELDRRFRAVWGTIPFREFLQREYRTFREPLQPEPERWWWWLDQRTKN